MVILLSPSKVLVMFLLFGLTLSCWAYVRPEPRGLLSVPETDDPDGLTPQQVHISLFGTDHMRISWLTKNPAPPTVKYGKSPNQYTSYANGTTTSYSYLLVYKSGQIYDAVIGPLEPNSIYYYKLSGCESREFSFKTPPSNLPINFVVAGDLGQTGWTKTTLQHISASPYDVLLLPGDLSYADLWQPRWDTFGRLVEPLASARPWMVTEGNHEIEKIPIIHSKSFVAYNARWPMPFSQCSSNSNLFYSFDVASVHVIMLGSYTDFGHGSDQFRWLETDLAKVDRKRTPWLIVIIHAPWYNTNKAHQNEGEEMRKAVEPLLRIAHVDIIFAGHVHAYERFTRVYNQVSDPCGPVHITIGDGGNREGLAEKYNDPQPAISLFREASFGHARFDVVNATHAFWAWHRNDDDVAVVADQVWINSLASNPNCWK